MKSPRVLARRVLLRNSAGAALLELCLVAPLLLLLTLAVLDLRGLMTTSLRLKEAAYSVARMASQDSRLTVGSLAQIHDISAGTFGGRVQGPISLGSPASDQGAQFLNLHSRTLSFLQAAQIIGLATNNILVKIALENTANSDLALDDISLIASRSAVLCSGDVVYVSMSTSYRTIFGLEVPLLARRWLPYLYQRSPISLAKCDTQGPTPLPPGDGGDGEDGSSEGVSRRPRNT